MVHAVRDGKAADERLRRRLDEVHAGLGHVERVENVVAGDRQGEEHQGEVVGHARPALRRWSDVDRNVGIEMVDAEIRAQRTEVVTEGARQTRDEHVVDGRARHVLYLLDEGQVDRLRPREQLRSG